MRNRREPTPGPSLKKGGEEAAPDAHTSIKAKKKYRISSKTKRARSLRNNATPAEKFLWTKLSRKQLGGFKFRRQYPAGLYVLDFYCVELKLCIELDGEQHGFDENLVKDERRTQYLEANGIVVIRFWNNEIFEKFDTVVDAIYHEAMLRKQYLEMQKRGFPSP